MKTRTKFPRFRTDSSGNAAVEFALLLPLMLSMLFGTIEITNMLMSDRKMINATQAAADLIAQSKSFSSADMDDVFAATKAILAPFPSATLSLGVTHVRYDGSGTAYVAWTDSRNGGSVASPLTISAGLGKAQESVVVVELQYTYAPILGNLFLTPTPDSKQAVARPRRVLWIPKT